MKYGNRLQLFCGELNERVKMVIFLEKIGNELSILHFECPTAEETGSIHAVKHKIHDFLRLKLLSYHSKIVEPCIKERSTV